MQILTGGSVDLSVLVMVFALLAICNQLLASRI